MSSKVSEHLAMVNSCRLRGGQGTTRPLNSASNEMPGKRSTGSPSPRRPESQKTTSFLRYNLAQPGSTGSASLPRKIRPIENLRDSMFLCEYSATLVDLCLEDCC